MIRIIIISGLFFVIVLFFWGAMCAHSDNGLILIPEPTLGRYIFGGYTLDRGATEAHYDSLFEGKTAEEVIRFLEERDKKIIYNSENEISIFLERLVTFFYFGAGLNFEFKDGVFERAKIWGAGVK